MQFSTHDVIAAIATPPGNGGVGIVRVSGENLLPFAQNLTAKKEIKARFAYFSHFYDSDHHSIDSGLLLYFPAPHSFTGEDVVELQAHGGTVVLNLLLERCLQLGARLAEPGEFSFRAFKNKKMDLITAEGVADLITATSVTAVKMANRSLRGDFSTAISALNADLIALRARIEASLDFPEEEDDFLGNKKITAELSALAKKAHELLASAKQGSLLQSGIQVALIGAPNVGKSSLLNRLAQNEVAIVTDIAGTTRDLVREKILIQDIPVELIDTAGLRETQDKIETLGIKKSRDSAQVADIALVLIDPKEGINAETKALIAALDPGTKIIYAYNKTDLYPEGFPSLSLPGPVLSLSVKENQGIEALKAAILKAMAVNPEREDLFLARKRHINALVQVLSEIVLAEEQTDFLDLVAEHLKNAQVYLNQLTGGYTADDLLGEIFSHFCLGK